MTKTRYFVQDGSDIKFKEVTYQAFTTETWPKGYVNNTVVARHCDDGAWLFDVSLGNVFACTIAEVNLLVFRLQGHFVPFPREG